MNNEESLIELAKLAISNSLTAEEIGRKEHLEDTLFDLYDKQGKSLIDDLNVVVSRIAPGVEFSVMKHVVTTTA